MRTAALFIGCVIVLGVITPSPAHAATKGNTYVPVTTFDSSRNAAKDIQAAMAEAQRTGRRVLLDVGGNWCVWCRRMDEMFGSNKELATTRDKYFVTVKINYSTENKNETLLSHYPKVPGYPHLFVLENNGKLLKSQSTADFESGKGYNPSRIMGFLNKWGPKK